MSRLLERVRKPGMARDESRVSRDSAATTKRNRIVFAAASVLALVGAYFGAIKPKNSQLRETRAQADQVDLQVSQLTGQLAHLRDLQRRVVELREQAGRLDQALPLDAREDDFILQVYEAGKQANLGWESFTAAPPAASGAAPGLMESSITITGSGKYAEIQGFLVRLENLERALKIGSIDLTGGDQSSETLLKMTINLKMFLAPSAPPFPSESALVALAPAPGPPTPTTASAAGPPMSTQ